jgi:hypothetical protein
MTRADPLTHRRSDTEKFGRSRGRLFDLWEMRMTPEELRAKVEELRALIADKLAELEEEPNWGSEDEREELVQALDDLVVQGEALSELLQEGT